MSIEISRRGFLGAAAATGAGFFINTSSAPVRAAGPNEKLNIACIGVGGKGASNVAGCAGENIVALCDVDANTLGKAAQKYAKAEKYSDFRKMLERKDIDAVTVSTPDHVHAVAAAMALKTGRHVYCEKPLTRAVYEARYLTELAAKNPKLATQMGNQGHSGANMRVIVESIRAGVIGKVKEVHCWTNRPIWPQGMDRPAGSMEVPGHLSWDLWLGPAPERPYNKGYHPFAWRGWWDFGTGALGDMACHIMDAPFWALDLGSPVAVEAEGPKPHPESAPTWCTVRWTFPARGDMPPVTVTWYDGKKDGKPNLPPAELVHGEKLTAGGSIMVGEKGVLYSAHDYGGKHLLLPSKDFADYMPPAPTLPRSSGHYSDWISAAKSGGKACSDFSYAGKLTETILLGNVAFRVGKKIEWDGAALKATNAPEAEPLIKPEYRKGWEL